MSIYYNRTEPTYGTFDDLVDLKDANNKYILAWWTSKHDNLMKELITSQHWDWYWSITDQIVNISDTFIIENWKESDPKCNERAWYNVLMYFAGARAKKLGLLSLIKKAKWKVCPLCNNKFIESSLPSPLIKRLGINNLDFCSPCLSSRILPGSGNNTLSKKEIELYLKDLSTIISKIPHQNFGEGINDWLDIPFNLRYKALSLMSMKPTLVLIKKTYGSWLKALIDSEVLENGARKTSRGIQSIAIDGHICLSLGERTIDDFLFKHKIKHQKEPHYPDSNYRADFLVDNVFIEYFGMKGNVEYDKKTKQKKRLCKKLKIDLISIYPEDLVNISRLQKKLIKFL